MVKSTTSPRPDKPSKPYPDFPLFPHATRRWAKKVRGKFWFFGRWDDPQTALQRWLDQKDDLLAGRIPRQRLPKTGVFLQDLCNAFLTTKTKAVVNSELSVRSFDDYAATCARLIDAFKSDRLLTDILPVDFEKLREEMAKSWGHVRLGNEINRVRVIFNYGYKHGILEKPMLYGEGFRRPSKKTLRKARKEKGERIFTAEELRRAIAAAGQPLKSMLLLGINAALGNEDVGQLPLKAVNLKTGWLDFPRPKTGIDRRCKLWPETIASIKKWLKVRPTPKAEPAVSIAQWLELRPSQEDESIESIQQWLKARPNESVGDLLFLTATRAPWSKTTSDNPVSKETRKLLDGLGINGNKNFYAIRHTFQTVADGSKDKVAVDFLMGHADESISSAYREGIPDDRLVAVVVHVHKWLFSR